MRWYWKKDVKASVPLDAYDKRGSTNPKWRGGVVNTHGRIAIYSPNHPHPNYLKIYVYRYRLVMEKKLGRFLLPSEIVHHKNGIVNDDRLCNLQVTNQVDHSRHHMTLRKRDKLGRMLPVKRKS